MNMLIVFQFYYKVGDCRVTKHFKTIFQKRLGSNIAVSQCLREWDFHDQTYCQKIATLCLDSLASYKVTQVIALESGSCCLV